MEGKNRRKTGALQEEKAAAYLTERGFRITERNFRSSQGEIDIIGYDGDYLVFVEVKYRSSDVYDNPLEAVGSAKRKKICRVAEYYRYTKGIGREVPVRYDVVGIWREEIAWIPNAFPHVYGRG